MSSERSLNRTRVFNDLNSRRDCGCLGSEIKMSGACPVFLAPDYQNCSGHGVCIEGQGCICDDGWNGAGDFSFGKTCSINVQAVRALWSLTAIGSLALFLYTVYFTWCKMFRSPKRNILHLVFGICGLIHGSCLFCAGILRVVDVETRAIGSDPAVTVLFSIGGACWWIETYLSIYSFVRLASSQAQKGLKDNEFLVTMQRFRIQVPIWGVISVIGCLFPLGCLTATSQEQFFAFAACHYLLLAFAEAIGGLYTIPNVVGSLEKDIQTAIGADIGGNKNIAQYRELLKKVKAFRVELFQQAIFNVVTAVLFGGWPYLQRTASSYWVPIAWFTGCTVGCRNVYTMLPVVISPKDESGQSSNKVSNPKVAEAGSMSPVTEHKQATGRIEPFSSPGMDDRAN